MKRRFVCVCFMLLVCFLAVAQSAPPQQKTPKQLFVRCGRLIADTEKPALSNVAAIITDGKITSVGKDLSAPAGAETVDFSRYTVLPGLLDAHIHLWTGPRSEHPSAALAALRSQKAMQYALSQGVVAVRVLGSGDFIDTALARASDE